MYVSNELHRTEHSRKYMYRMTQKHAICFHFSEFELCKEQRFYHSKLQGVNK